jgi:hypothetical protein
MDYLAKEPGGEEGKCNVSLCPCIEQHMRVRKLLSLLHTIPSKDCKSVLANACWDTTTADAITAASQDVTGDRAIVDDAATVQLPVSCVHALLMHGASPDHSGRDGQTALEAAIVCKNVAAAAALCTYAADASAYASQEMLDGITLVADSKDTRVAKLQELLKKHSPTGKGSISEAAQITSRSAWLRLAARICWVYNVQSPPIQRSREASQAPDAAAAISIVQCSRDVSLKPAVDLSRV